MMPSTKNIDLLSLGNTIVDMEYQVSEETLEELGIEKGSMTLIDKEKRDELRSSLGDNVHLCNGGSAANSLFVSKQLGLQVHHLGVVGTDALSKFVIEDYDATGIKQSFKHTQIDGDTGCCLVLITPDGERTMLTYLGVSNQFKSVDELLPFIADSKQLFIEGYLIADDHCYELIHATIIPFAKENDTQIAFTLSDAGLISFFKERFERLVRMELDIVLEIFKRRPHFQRLIPSMEFKLSSQNWHMKPLLLMGKMVLILFIQMVLPTAQQRLSNRWTQQAPGMHLLAHTWPRSLTIAL